VPPLPLTISVLTLAIPSQYRQAKGHEPAKTIESDVSSLDRVSLLDCNEPSEIFTH
jgi:hypothetical protein